jgi:hypothetical protein
VGERGRTVGGEGVAHPLLVDDVDEDAQAQVLLQPAHLLLGSVVSSTLPSGAAAAAAAAAVRWLPEPCPLGEVNWSPAVSTGIKLSGCIYTACVLFWAGIRLRMGTGRIGTDPRKKIVLVLRVWKGITLYAGKFPLKSRLEARLSFSL